MVLIGLRLIENYCNHIVLVRGPYNAKRPGQNWGKFPYRDSRGGVVWRISITLSPHTITAVSVIDPYVERDLFADKSPDLPTGPNSFSIRDMPEPLDSEAEHRSRS